MRALAQINHKKMYAVYRRIDEICSERKKNYRPLRMIDIYRQTASDMGYMSERHIVEIYAYVHNNKHKPEFKREGMLYEERTRNYSQKYASAEDKKNIEKIKNAKNLVKLNRKSEWHYYIYKRYEELLAERKNTKKHKIGIYMDIADEFLLRNHISACNIIASVKKILTN